MRRSERPNTRGHEQERLDYLDLVRIFGDRQTRELVVEGDNIRRGEFAGDEDFSGPDDD